MEDRATLKDRDKDRSRDEVGNTRDEMGKAREGRGRGGEWREGEWGGRGEEKERERRRERETRRGRDCLEDAARTKRSRGRNSLEDQTISRTNLSGGRGAIQSLRT